MATDNLPRDDGVGMHWSCLTVGLLVMVGATIYPLGMTNAAGHASHSLAMALFWAMSAGFIRGVGFVPRHVVWRWLFSAWACLAALVLATVIKCMHQGY